MHLKKIEVYGFKSFAEKINMEFDLGVTCVVGPNGSGKSNISDCVRWVLGEQSAKNLRGGKMEDVIFAGTQYRKSMGFAKVSLVLDNVDGSLPIDYDEVTVTRKLYRSGESEYFINNTTCRLKDIHELFMDTGIGKDGYSIIGQGRVDEILSTKSEDRRAIFEEASGIVKYKSRKNEALRKLEQTSRNMERINDTVSMLQEQLNPLEKQAHVAQKYRELKQRLKELEVLLYIDKIGKTCEGQKSIGEEYQKSLSMVHVEEMALKKMEDLYSEKNENLQCMLKKLEDTKNEYYKNEGTIGGIAHKIQMDEERKRSINLNLFRLKDEMGKLDAGISHAKREESNYSDKLKKIEKEQEEYNLKLGQEEKKLNGIIDNLTDKQKEMENLNDRYLEKLNEKTVMINVVNSGTSLLEGIEIKKIELVDKKNRCESDALVHKKHMDELERNIQNFQDILIKTSEVVKSKEKCIKDISGKIEDTTKKLNDLTVALNSDISKYKILKDLEDNFEGYTKSVKLILKLCGTDKSFDRGIHGALLGLISVPKMAEVAIEVALGSALQYIVTDTEDEAKRVIDYLKKNNIGRATFLPISSVKGKAFDKDQADKIKLSDGFVGFAHEVISYDKKYEGIILSFLGKIVLVDDLQQGIDMARKFNHKFKIVTLKGEFLNIGGSITGGSISGRDAGMIARGRQIKELKEAIDSKKILLKEKDEELEEMKIDRENNQKELTFDQQKQKEYEMAMLKEVGTRERLKDDHERAMEDLENSSNQLNELLKEEKEAKDKYESDKKRLAEVEKEIDDIQVMVVKNKEKHKRKLRERESVQGSIMQINIELNKVIELARSITELQNKEANHRKELEDSVIKKNEQSDEFKKEILAIDEDISRLKADLICESKNKDSIYESMVNLEKDKKQIEQEVEKVFGDIRKINKNIIALKEEFSRVENKKERIDSEIKYLKDKLWEEYELTYNNAVNLNKDVQKKVTQKEINDIRADIKALGDVNMGAIEEYDKVRENYDFLMEQKNDMEKSEQNLKKAILDITNVMKEQFVTQFELINENFNVVFSELFEGGRAKLILDDESNVLESGIQIQVQPPGKKLQNMMLLSGGERAFTAIALLFAIIKLRPAPFCILDEIEAALDDANVYKFADYIKRHIDLSQCILITHRKGTMEAADSIYGVTMQEQGVSKVVSLRLDEVCEEEILERVE